MLDEAGALRSTRKGFLATGMSSDAAVTEALRTVELRERVDLSRVEMMRGYAETSCCRRIFLLAYFGAYRTGACGNCDRCLAADELDDVSVESPALQANTAVRHRDWGTGVVIGGDRERITVLFRGIRLSRTVDGRGARARAARGDARQRRAGRGVGP